MASWSALNTCGDTVRVQTPTAPKVPSSEHNGEGEAAAAAAEEEDDEEEGDDESIIHSLTKNSYVIGGKASNVSFKAEKLARERATFRWYTPPCSRENVAT